MASGPSKEQLKMYWESSRQYFDELANYYKTADPQYYNEFIAPFYSPFNTVSPGRQSSKGVKSILISLFAVLLLAGVGLAVFLFSLDGSDEKKIEKIFDSSDEKNDKENTYYPEKNVLEDNDFIKGSKYLETKDYDKAEEHFKKVKKDDPFYEQAQELLKNMKYLRKYDPKK